ncbi:MAG: hypothetical protein MJ065_03160, partial [Oscillospiraceae bacterium]|nr:hypothetical protein [Oscillospiraceae bacterium]
RRPAASGERRPAASGERRPAASGERRPAASGERRPAASGERRPAASGERRPAASGERRPAASGERRPAASGERRPAASGERRPARTPEERTRSAQRQRPEVEYVDGAAPRRRTRPADDAQHRSRRADGAKRRKPQTAPAARSSAKRSAETNTAEAGKRKPSKFRIGLVIYIVVFLLLMTFGLFRFRKFLAEFESSLPQHTIENYVQHLDSTFYNDMVRQKVDQIPVTQYETADTIAETLNLGTEQSEGFSFAKKGDEFTDEKPVYYIRSGESAIAKVTLSKAGETPSFHKPVWKVDDPESLFEISSEPEYTLDVTVPEGSSVSVNGITVPADQLAAGEALITLDNASLAFAKSPGSKKISITGLYVTPKVEAFDALGNALEAAEKPNGNVKTQTYVYGPKSEPAPDPAFVQHVKDMMAAYINYSVNKDDQVWTNLGVLDPYLVAHGTAYETLHSMVMDFNWNNPYNARQDRDLTVSNVKMYSDSVCTVDVHFDYSLTKYNAELGRDITNDYIGTIRWTMVNAGGTWKACNLQQLTDDEDAAAAPADTAVPTDETAAPTEETAAPADAAAPADPAV